MFRHRILSLVLLLVCAGTGFQCGGGGGDSPTAPPRVIRISITENSFNPKSITISAGDTVVWTLDGSDATHTSTAMQGSWDSGTIFLQPGDSFQRTFGTSDNGQTFEYFCRSHQGCCAMQGSIRVGEDAPDPRDGY